MREEIEEYSKFGPELKQIRIGAFLTSNNVWLTNNV